jgi:hypothetical protein
VVAGSPPDGKRWWSYVKALASDDMKGRDTGTPEYLRAARYVASEFEKAGLKPAAETGPLQPVKLRTWKIAESASSLSTRALQSSGSSCVYYGAGAHTFARDQIGPRYLFAFVRALVDPNRSGDLAEAHKVQDAVRVSQSGGPGKLELPKWDAASQDKVRRALLQLNETLPDLRKAGGRRDEVDPVRQLIASASGWGLNPDKDAILPDRHARAERRQGRVPAECVK